MDDGRFDGLSSLRDQAPMGLAHSASIPSADSVESVISAALVRRDQACSECPVNNPRFGAYPHANRYKECPKCGSTPSGPCWASVGADAEFVKFVKDVLGQTLTSYMDRQGRRADCAIRLPHPAAICTCHVADKQRAEVFAKAIEAEGRDGEAGSVHESASPQEFAR